MAFAARVFAVGNCIASEWPKDLDSIGISKQKHLHHGSDRSIQKGECCCIGSICRILLAILNAFQKSLTRDSHERRVRSPSIPRTMSSLSQNEMSLVCHLTAIPTLSSSISIQRDLIFIQCQIRQAPNHDP